MPSALPGRRVRALSSSARLPPWTPKRPIVHRGSRQPPQVKGPQTAIVVGKAGEEIRTTDQYGRVKVQFHWDRYGKSDENSSCWARVSQPWAGKNWGTMAIPRIGQEVVVEFLEGDPNQLIITGGVYNDVNKPPYKLPAGAAISGLKSNSTKGGGGYNEYVMDDTKGKELIREHGQFDKDSTIEHDLREQVLNDRSRDVTNNETIQVGNDRSKTVRNNETIVIGADRTEQVGGSVSLQVAGNLILEAGGGITLKVGGGWLVVDHSGVTVSNSPPNQPVVNAGSLPLSGLTRLLDGMNRAQAPMSALRGQGPAQTPDASCAGVGALASEVNAKDYTRDFKQLQQYWPRLDLEARKLRMGAIINKQLAKSGTPPVEEVSSEPLAEGRGGYFFALRWLITLEPRPGERICAVGLRCRETCHGALS